MESPQSSFAERCHDYAERVVAGDVVACKWLRLACDRHLRDMKAQKGEAFPYKFMPYYANDVCEFAERMPHVEGVWETPTIRLEDPQVFILACVFGWRRKDDELRRFSSVYIEMARKGAKSTLTAVVALYGVSCEDEPGAQVIIGATTAEQALKVFGPAKKMCEQLPMLREAKGMAVWARSITCAETGGFIQPINSKGKTQDGWNPHIGILDELHAHPDRALYDVISSAFGSRKNPLKWLITTAGYNTNGVCYEQRQYVTKVLDGAIEADHYFGVIFTLDEGDDPFDEAVWSKANPMLGVTPTLNSMRSEAADAKASPASEGEFKTKRLNVWMNAASAWLNVHQWSLCADPSLSWDAFAGRDVYVGGDLADKDDITALAIITFDDDGVMLCKTLFWLPEAVLQDPKHAEGRGPAPYRTWSQQGHLLLTPGDWVDHEEIEGQVRQWLDTYAVKRITFDQFAAAQTMASRLNEDYGDPDDPLAVILNKRASNVTDPAKELEARVKSGPSRFRHDDNPVMNWMASNVTVARRRDETLLPIKENQDSPNKIDGIDALVNAIHPALAVLQNDATTVPEDYEVMVV